MQDLFRLHLSGNMRSLAVILVISVFAHQTFADKPEAIVGGTPAKLGEFPWQISLQQNGQHICGGSIIAPNKILTAAHCIEGIFYPPYSDCRVVTGTNHVGRGQSHACKSIRVHPSYNGDIITNDVAVITLPEPIKYNEYQSAILLANSAPEPGMTCQLSGWGLTRAGGSASPILLKMTQPTISRTQCQQALRGLLINESNVCALRQRGIGACQGDSGGPFVCKVDGTIYQYGITSWGIPCAEGYPDVYTNVFHHLAFIQQS